MGAGPSRAGYRRGTSRSAVGTGPTRVGYSAGPSRGGVGAGPSRSSSSAGPSRAGVAAGPSRGGTAAARGMSKVSGDLQALGRVGSGILHGPVTQRGRGRGRGGPTEAIIISSSMLNLILQLIRSME